MDQHQLKSHTENIYHRITQFLWKYDKKATSDSYHSIPHKKIDRFGRNPFFSILEFRWREKLYLNNHHYSAAENHHDDGFHYSEHEYEIGFEISNVCHEKHVIIVLDELSCSEKTKHLYF